MSLPNNTRQPSFETDRLLLRHIVASDIDRVFEGLSHPDVIRFYGIQFDSFEATQLQMDWYKTLLANNTGRCWAVCEKERPNELIGVVAMYHWNPIHRNAEIGFWLLPQYFGKGIMTEAMKMLLPHLQHDLHIHRLEAIVEVGNAQSANLLHKLGFCYEGCKKEAEIKQGQFIDLAWYALLSEEQSA